MARKYYWLKLKEDFFDDDAINWLEEQSKGKEYSLFYLKLCLKSLKTDGILIRNVGNILVPYDTKKLSEITKTDFDTVVVAMELLKTIGLIEIMENGEIYLPGLQQMVGSETDKAKLMRNMREREKLPETLDSNNVTTTLPESYQDVTSTLPNSIGNNVTELLPNCYTEIEKEYRDRDKEYRDRDRDIEKREREKESDDIVSKDTICSTDVQRITDEWNAIGINKINKIIPNTQRYKCLKIRIRDYGIEQVLEAIENIKSSLFLQGVNNKGWQISFDWFVKPNNFHKVLEGNYNNRDNNTSSVPNNGDVLGNMIDRGVFDE